MKASSVVLALCMGLLLSVGTARADQSGTISDDVLAQMGLAGMDQVSDDQGMDIRGKGWGGWGWHGKGGWGGWGHWGHGHFGHGHRGSPGWGGFSKYELKIKIKIKR